MPNPIRLGPDGRAKSGDQPLIRNDTSPPDWPARLMRAGEALGWALVGLVLARAVWLAITPAGPLGDWQAAAPPALAGVAVDPFFPQADTPADAVSGLDLALVGTRVDAASGRGSAIIATPDGQQQGFASGDEIMPGVRLVAVAFDSVTLDRGGARETLYIDQSGPAPTGTGK